MREVAASAEAPVYYAGPNFADLPLTHVESGGRGRAFFVYGSCDPGPDQGCAPPIQIQIFPFDAAMWRLAGGCKQMPSLRGVPTLRHDGLVLLTDRTVVKLYSRSSAEDRLLALALVNVQQPERTPRRFPPPPADVTRLIEAVCV